MNTKIIINSFFYIILALLSIISGSEESHSFAEFSRWVSLNGVRQHLIQMGVDAEVAERVDETKLERYVPLADLFLPPLKGTREREENFSMRCELFWYLDMINLDEAIDCISKHISTPTSIDEKFLVNAFADRHTFELKEIVSQDKVLVDDESELRRHASELLSFSGSTDTGTVYPFLQHAIYLLKKNSQSLEYQNMFKNMMTLHLSACAMNVKSKEAISVLYDGLRVDVPTLFFVSLPRHAAAVVVTLRSNSTYDVVLVNSGDGLENHQLNYVQEKGFHKAQTLGIARAYVPTKEFKGVTWAQLEKANYHVGTMEQVYYKDQLEVRIVEHRNIMPWELTDSQGIGSCAASSIWYALHFYYQALVYENDLRLSMLERAIVETVELQEEIRKVEGQIDADYFKRREVAKKVPVPYHSRDAKELWDKKDKLQERVQMRRELVTVGLNGILQNLIILFHELSDIRSRAIFWQNNKSEGRHAIQWIPKEKVSARDKILREAIPRIMNSFHTFWTGQTRLCESKLEESAIAKHDRIMNCMTWNIIEDNTRSLYNDAVKLIEGRSLEFVKEQFSPLPVKREERLNVSSLPIHNSLRLILNRILADGDSEALRTAIDEHLRVHSKHPQNKDANYLLVLYTTLGKNVPLLDFLVNGKGLPLMYRFRVFVQKDELMLLPDLKREEDISRLATLEFKKYGQPLDNFTELFSMNTKPAKDIARAFGRAHRRNIYDDAIFELAKNGKLALLAITIPKTSKEARMDLFMDNNDVKVLNMLIEDVNHQQLTTKLSEMVTKDKIMVVETLFPRWLSGEHRKQAAESGKKSIDDRRVKVPNEWMTTASEGQFVDILRLLLPYSDLSHVSDCFLEVSGKGYTDTVIILAEYLVDFVPDAISRAVNHGHTELARTLLRLYPSQKAIDNAFDSSVTRGNAALVRDLVDYFGRPKIDSALNTTIENGHFEVANILLEYASVGAVEKVIENMIGNELADRAFTKALTFISDSDVFRRLFFRASERGDRKAMEALMPFVTMNDIERGLRGACVKNQLTTVSFLIPFAKMSDANVCFDILVEREKTPTELLEQLIPHMSREVVFNANNPSKREKLKESTITAIERRIEAFPAEVAFVYAFRRESRFYSHYNLLNAQLEAKKYGFELPTLCANSDECTKVVERSKDLVPPATVEEVVDIIEFMEIENVPNVAPRLIQFASPLTCTKLLKPHVDLMTLVPSIADVCADKTLPTVLVHQCHSAISEGKFDVLKNSIRFLSSIDVFHFLRYWSKKEPKLISEIVNMLSGEQIENIVKLLVRDRDIFDGAPDALITELFGKVHKSVVDASLMYAVRSLYPKESLGKFSQFATEEGRRAAEQLSIKLVQGERGY